MAEWEKEKLNNHWDAAETKKADDGTTIRRIFNQEQLNKDADYHKPSKHFLQLKGAVKSSIKNVGPLSFLTGCLPILQWLPMYKCRRDFIGDLIAGCTTAIMHIPQGMAYGLLTEVQPIVGLYMAFFPVLVYVIFGTSPHISIGTFAVACLMSGKVVTKFADFNSTEVLNHTETIHNVHYTGYTPMEVLCAVTLMVGITQMIMWALRLGVLSTLLSDPLVSGFTTAAAFHVIASQIKDLFGLPLVKFMGNFKIIYTLIESVKKISNANVAAIIISAITCTVVALNNELLKPWVSKKSRIPVPIELITVVIGTLVSKYTNLKENYGVNIISNVPTGIPIPAVPSLDLMRLVAFDTITITMVTYTISMSMALIFAAKEKYEVSANQELLALGSSNIFGAFFSCGPICASLARSYIQYQAGGKTPITSVISALLILMVLLWMGPFFEDLPRAVLASIIIISLKGLVLQVKQLRKFWKLSKLDAAVWLITFLVTVFINIDFGLLTGMAASAATLFIRAHHPYTCILGRVQETDIYLDIKRYRNAEEITGIKIFHYCGSLNFASKNLFKSLLFKKIGFIWTEGSFDNSTNDASTRVNCVIIDLTALSYVDAPGVKMLSTIHNDLSNNGVHVLLAGPNGPVREMIDRYNKLEPQKLQIDIFPTVHDAVEYFQTHKTYMNDTLGFSGSDVP